MKNAAQWFMRIIAGAAVCLAPGLAQSLSTDAIQLPTGLAITPTAAPHSVFQTLNPGLPGLSNFVAGQAVTTALSPDGKQLVILTSG